MDKQAQKIIAQLNQKIDGLTQQLEKCNRDFYNAIAKNRDGILVFDQSGKILYVNPATLNLFDKNPGELLGENIGVFFDTTKKTELTIRPKNKEPVIVEVNIANISWNGKPAHLASLRDMTEHKKTEKMLERLSNYDYLTDLTNRVFFEENLKNALDRANRIGKKIVLFFIDIDFFKAVNDTYGHRVGDKLLVHVAHILKSSTRKEDLVSRLGGDEFAIILERQDKPAAIEKIAKKLLAAIEKDIIIENHELNVNFSIGISIYPDSAKNIDELISQADSAMYVSKRSGRGQYHFYSNNK